MKEGDVPLSDREEPRNTDTSGSNKKIPLNCPKGTKGFLWKDDMANSPAEVPLHQCTQHGKQSGGTGNHGAIGKLWHDCYHGNMVG